MLLAVVFLALLALSGPAAAGSARVPIVTCESIITPGGAYSWRPSRVVLGVVDVPPAYIPQTASTNETPWRYWSKVGLVVRANSPDVVVTVPHAWRAQAAITWGNAGPASTLRIRTCPPSSPLGGWNPYAGGFLLKAKSACVPLVFRVGARTATRRFGVGKRCA